MAVRTFLALPLDETILRHLVRAQQTLSSAGASVRWTATSNLHLTVKFLGDVKDADLAEVCRIAGDAASRVEPFEFSVTGLVSAPPGGRMRMVWAGVVEATGRLQRLQGMLEDAYAALGFKKENRAFHPHLTVGRVRSGANVARLRAAVDELADEEFGTQPAQELIVFSSKLTPGGPIYSPLETARLAGA